MRFRAAAAALLLAMPGLAQNGPQAFSLPNGLRVLLLEDHERPLVRAQLHLPLGPEARSIRPGLAPLLQRVLAHSGAGVQEAQDFDRTLEGTGIRLALSLREDGLDWTLLARSRDQDLALGLLADRVLRPIFDPSALEAQRVACWRACEEAAPEVRLRQALEPGWALQAPTLEALVAITYEDLLAFRAQVVRPDRALLILHGDLGKEQAKRLVLLSFGTWTALAAPPPSTPPAPALPPAAGPVRIAAPGAASRALATAAAPEGLAPEDAVLLALLLPADAALRPVQIQIEGSTLVATLPSEATAESAEALLRQRLQALRQRGFSEADLQRARAAWSAGRSLVSLHPEAQMEEALAEALSRAPSPARMDALTLEALNDALRRWLDPARLRTGALSAASKP